MMPAAFPSKTNTKKAQETIKINYKSKAKIERMFLRANKSKDNWTKDKRKVQNWGE
jgi:hypothetical protein